MEGDERVCWVVTGNELTTRDYCLNPPTQQQDDDWMFTREYKQVIESNRKQLIETIRGHQLKEIDSGSKVNQETVSSEDIRLGLLAFTFLTSLPGMSITGGCQEGSIQTDDSQRIELPQLMMAYLHDKDKRAEINEIINRK